MLKAPRAWHAHRVRRAYCARRGYRTRCANRVRQECRVKNARQPSQALQATQTICVRLAVPLLRAFTREFAVECCPLLRALRITDARSRVRNRLVLVAHVGAIGALRYQRHAQNLCLHSGRPQQTLRRSQRLAVKLRDALQTICLVPVLIVELHLRRNALNTLSLRCRSAGVGVMKKRKALTAPVRRRAGLVQIQGYR